MESLLRSCRQLQGIKAGRTMIYVSQWAAVQEFYLCLYVFDEKAFKKRRRRYSDLESPSNINSCAGLIGRSLSILTTLPHCRNAAQGLIGRHTKMNVEEELWNLQNKPESLTSRLTRDTFTHGDHGSFNRLATVKFLIQADKDAAKQGRRAYSYKCCDTVDRHGDNYQCDVSSAHIVYQWRSQHSRRLTVARTSGLWIHITCID